MSIRDLFSRKSKNDDPYSLPSTHEVDTQVHRSSMRYEALAHDPHPASSPPRAASPLGAAAEEHAVPIPVDASPAAELLVRVLALFFFFVTPPLNPCKPLPLDRLRPPTHF
jgi:hypothetical protein